MATNLKTELVGAAAAFKQNLLSSLSSVKQEAIDRVIPDFVKESAPPLTPISTNSSGSASQSLATAIFNRESSGNYNSINDLHYAGGYQFGAMALEDTGMLKPGSGALGNAVAMNNPDNWTGRGGVTDLASFLANTGLQDQLFQENFDANRKRLIGNGTITEDMPEADAIGYTTAAHLLGATGTARGLDNEDANGTKGREFFNIGKASATPEPSSSETNIASIRRASEPGVPGLVGEYPNQTTREPVDNPSGDAEALVAAMSQKEAVYDVAGDQTPKETLIPAEIEVEAKTEEPVAPTKTALEQLEAAVAGVDAKRAQDFIASEAKEDTSQPTDRNTSLTPVTAAVAYPQVSDDPEDVQNYANLSDWVAVNGQPSIDTSRYFMERQTAERLASIDRAFKEQKIRESRAWASDAELATKIGAAKQNVTSLAVGTLRIAGHAIALPYTTQAASGRASVDDRAIRLYERSLIAKDTLNADENAYLDTSPDPDGPPMGTRREILKRTYLNEQIANAISDIVGPEGFIGKPVNDLVNPIDKALLNEGLDRTYDQSGIVEAFAAAEIQYKQGDLGEAVMSAATGVIGLTMDGIDDLQDNPSATFQYISENIPQLALGAVSRPALLVTNFAYGADIYSDALADYKKTHGKSPTQEEAAHMAAWALSASALEQVADLSILKQLKRIPGGTADTATTLTKLLPNKLLDAVTTAAASTTGRVVAATVNNPITRTGKALVRGAVVEGPTEAYQTAVEENFSRLNRDFDGANIFQGYMIGIGAGATLTATRTAVSELANMGSTRPSAPISKKDKKLTELTRDGAVTGNVEPLLDESTPETYSPLNAVEALATKISDPAISEVERTALRTQIDELIETQNKNVEALNVEMTQLEAEFNSTTDPVEKQKLDKRLDALALQLDEAPDISARMSVYREVGVSRVTGQSNVDVDALIAEAGSPDASPTQVKAADNIIELMMSSFDTVSSEQVETLKQSPLLTSEQRTYVNNFSEAHSKLNELNTTDATNTDVVNGRNGFKGVLQYELNIAAALRDGNIPEAEKEIASLENFLANHKGKQAGLEAGLEATQGKASSTTHLIRDNNESSGWRIATETPQGWNRKRNGGWDFKNPNGTRNVIERVTEENAILEAAVEQHKAALALMGNTQSNSTPDPIENTDAQPKESDQADGVAVTPGLTDPETQPEGVNDQTDEQTETETDVDQETAGQEETPESDLGEEQNVEEDSVEEDSFDQGEIAGLDPASRVEGNMTGEQLTLPSTNFIAAYFTQRSPDEESGSVNPLVYVKDFMSWVYEGNALNLDKLQSFVANAKLTPAQIDLFTLFRAKHEEWKETIEKNINDSATTLREKTSKTPERDFKYEDYTQHFKGAVPENLITAISTGAFLWLSENAGGTGINTVSVIKQMLGLKEDDTVDPQDIIRFTHVGTRRDFVIQDLGEKVRQALEMTTHKNVPIDELAKFELAMGAHAFALLQQMGLTQQTAEIALTSESLAFLEQAEQTDENNDFNPPSLYVKATRNGTIPIQANEEIVVASRLGDRFLNQLMSVEEKIVPPALKPGMFNQLKTKIKQLVPKTQQKIAKLVSKRPHSIRQDMKRVRDSLSDIGQLQVTGWVDLDSGQNWHDGIKIPQESRNEELERGNTALKEFDEQVGLEDFFTVPVIWKHQRTGQSSNTINTQTNKQHRHNVTMNAWGVEVDPTIDNALLRNFKLAIAQGMGLKVDKQNPERSIAQLNALMASEEVQDALDALALIDSIEPGTKLPEPEENAIIAVTQGIKVKYNNNNLKVGGENTHTLDALVNWLAYLNATEEKTSFTTEMLFEVDGVTNGPALSLIMMGAVNSLLGEKFGMFGTSSPHTSHAEYISDTNNDDLYETIVKNAKLLINQNKTAIKLQDDMGSLFKLDRNEIKTPVQMMFFGANLEKAIQSLASGIEERFYQEIQDISNDTSTTEQEALKATRNVIDRLNVLLDDQNALPYFKTGQEALSTVLKPAQVKMIGESFYNKSGKHIKTALERQFASFQASRSEMNKSATATWLRYDAAYQFLYSAEVARKIKKGTMPTDSAGNPLQELTDTDIAAIDTLLKEHNFVPVMHTPLSKGDMNLDAGIRADQSEYVTDEDSQTYFQSVRFGMPVPTVRTKTNRKGTLSQLSVTGRRRGSVDPGVAPFILMIHALDSAISTLAIRVMKALNIHDAHGLGVSNIKQGANELNKHTFNLLANFSVPMELADSLQRSMDGELGLLESLSEDQQAYGDLAAVLSDVALESEFEPDIFVDMRYMENVRRFALRAESNKLGYLSQIGLVDQYSFPGGAYEVSAQQRELAARNKAVIDAQLKELNNKPKQGTTTEEKVEVPPVVSTPLPEETPWGVVGNGTNNSDPELVAMLSGDNVTIGSLLKPLANLIKSYENNPYNKFQIELLRRIYETTPSDTKIILVNANTPVPASIAKAIKEGKSRGLFSVRNGVRTIYIRGPQFEGPGVTSEVVLHELSHAATAEVVKAAREDKTSMPLHVVEAVADLEQLRERAQQYMVDNKIESEAHTLALSSVDELVAFGMTNPQFQQEILAKVTFPIEEQNRSGEPAKNGLKRFFDAISTIIFGSAKEDQSNGLGVLVYNVGVLTQQTAEIKTAEQGDINLSIEETTPRTFDTRQVYEALASRDSTEAISPIHDMRLRSILAAVVSAAYGNTGALKPAAERAAPVTAEDVFLNSLTSDIRPFASSLSAELLMTDQEAFVAESAELTLRAALSMREAVTNRNELTKLRNLAKKQITAEKLYDGDWANASNDQKRQAERVHSIIFDATQYDGNKSDYLSQFAAAALTYQPLVEQLALISIPENSETYAGLTVKEALELFFKKLMDMYVRFATGIEQNQNVPTRIMQLATNLATIENKEKSKIESRKDRPEPLLDQASKKLSDGIKQGVIAVADSGLVQGSKVKVVSALGSLVSTVAGERTEEVMRHFNKILDRDSGVRLSAQRELINEITNGRPDLQISNSLLNMSNKHEQDRKRLKEYTASATLTAFLGELNKKQSEALTKTFIKTDVSSLVDDFTLAEIEQLISDPVELNRAIAALEAQLAKENSAETYNYYSTSAEGLGIMMATGINLMEANLMHNAHNIAFLYATEQIITDQADVAANAALKIIDPLATLYALKHTSREQKNEASDLMRNEAARGNGQNGIDFLIKLHAEFKEQSKAKLFEGKDALMIKGYTKESYNPYIQVVSADPSEASELEAAGFVKVGEQELGQDPDDNSGAKALYKIRDRGLTPWVMGIIQNVGKRARGSTLSGSVVDTVDGVVHAGSKQEIDKITNRKRSKVRAMFKQRATFNLANYQGSYLSPVLNDQGNVAGYRYLMQETTKDSVLERDNRVDRVMGAIASSIFDKSNSTGLAETAIDAIKAQYDNDYLGNSGAYIYVTATSNDPVVRERYRVLPDETKRYIRKVFGQNGMYVRNDMYNITLGYRKFSVGDMFDKSPIDRNFTESLLVTALESIPVGWNYETNKPKLIGKRVALRLVQAENVWQEIVSMIKDVLVIKNLFTLMGNETSNASLLVLHGVPFVNVLKDKAVAWRATNRYLKIRKEHFDLEKQVELSYLTGPAAQAARQKMIELEEEMQSNAVHLLMENGMWGTIVEDIKVGEDDLHTYSSKLTTFIDDKTSWINPNVKEVAKFVTLAHGTGIYEFLNKATMMSDFTSRYVLHKHLTERNINPMSSEAALIEAKAAFVNYDVPTSKPLQYLNDMGLLWFTKYYLRIQAVIINRMRDNPLRVAALSGLDYYTSVSDVLDSFALAKSPLNFGAGPFDILDALDQPITIQAALGAYDTVTEE